MADPNPAKRHHPYRYDAVVKDLVQRDRSSILDAYIGSRQIRGFLNVEFALVEERIADLLIELDDGSILQIEFQSDSQSAMPYRMGIYGLLAAEMYRGRKLDQVVIYLGQDPLSMTSSIVVSVVLKDIYDAGMEKGRAEGRQEARTSMATVLRTLTEDRFGRLPTWADTRITGASIAELERWARKVLSAPTMEAALGR